MTGKRPRRRLAAILAADVVGYSRLMGADEEATLAALTAHLTELIEPAIGDHRGRVVKTTGDGLLAEFASVVDAVRCAVAIQGGMGERNAGTPDDLRIVFRIGVNLGDVIVQDDDVFGDGVNMAARLEGLAEPGAIVVSATVREHVRGKLEIGFDDLGPQQVKNIAEPVHAFRVRAGVGRAAEPPALPDKPSIAVLPFANMSGDPEQEYFADGIAEDIITGLSKFHWFFVIARNSSFAFKGEAMDVKRVAAELGVQYVLEGSVRKAGNRVRITAQLIDALTGRHVWAERYDRELHDIFAVQDEITEAIIGAVAPSFVSAEARRAERKAPESLDAWDCVMRATPLFWRMGGDNVARARALFVRATELDPTNSNAYAGIAVTCVWDAVLVWTEDAKNSREQALDAARKAVAVDPENAWAHAALGWVCTMLRDNETAIRSCEKALELNPNLAFAHGALGLTYAHHGASGSAIDHIDAADRLSPRDPARPLWTIGRCWVALANGDYESAAAWAKWMGESLPGFPAAWRHLAVACAHLDRLAEARAAVDRLLRVLPDDSLEFSHRVVPAGQPELLEMFVEGLRKAGLPE